MPRDRALEELLNNELDGVPGLTQKAMFGGWAWLVHGNLLCGVRVGSMMLRLGRESELWAAHIPGVAPMVMRGRRMHGWVRLSSEAYGNDEFRLKLINAALEFTGSLPKK